MGKHITLFRTFIGICLLVLVIYGATVYGDTIRYQISKTFHLPDTQVKGAAVKNEMTERLKSEAASGAATVTHNVMQIRVSDVVTFIGRAKKIGTDVQHLTQFVLAQTAPKPKGK